jgi:hypothetical protein
MKPLVYLNIKKVDILHHITNNLFTTEEANSIFDELKSLIINLTVVRHSETLTIEIINSLEEYQEKKKLIFQLWLLKSINNDDSFDYAYEFLAPKVNYCIFRQEVYRPKYISEPVLFKMLEDENYLMDKENALIFNEEILNKFYREFDGYFCKTTERATFKNWFRVEPVGQPDIEKDILPYFCYAVWGINDYRDKTRCPIIETWFSSLTGKKTLFSKLKGKVERRTIKSDMQTYIDNRIKIITHPVNG